MGIRQLEMGSQPAVAEVLPARLGARAEQRTDRSDSPDPEGVFALWERGGNLCPRIRALRSWYGRDAVRSRAVSMIERSRTLVSWAFFRRPNQQGDLRVPVCAIKIEESWPILKPGCSRDGIIGTTTQLNAHNGLHHSTVSVLNNLQPTRE